jgi:hypothetical protein
MLSEREVELIGEGVAVVPSVGQWRQCGDGGWEFFVFCFLFKGLKE